MCTGRVDLAFMLRAFAKGADGVFIGGCWPGDAYAVRQLTPVFYGLPALSVPDGTPPPAAWIVRRDPGRRVLYETADLADLAAWLGTTEDEGLNRLWLVGNKIQDADEAAFMEANDQGLPFLGYLPADSAVLEADRLGTAAYDHAPKLRQAAEEIAGRLVEALETERDLVSS